MSYYNKFPMLFSSGVAIDADAQSFITAASITDATQKSAINQLVLDLKGYNLWTKMYALYPFVGGAALPHTFNLKNTATYQITWTGGLTHSATGVLGSGGYGNTGFNPTTVGVNQNSWAFGFYSRTDNTVFSYDMGDALSSCRSEIDLSIGAAHYISNNSGFGSVTSGRTDGLFINSRITSANYNFYRNTTVLLNPSVASIGVGNNNMMVLYANGAGSATTKEQSLAFMSTGLDSTDVSNFTTTNLTYQTTLSRNI